VAGPGANVGVEAGADQATAPEVAQADAAGPAVDGAPPRVHVEWPGPMYWAKAALAVAVVVGICLLVVDVVDVLILILVSMVFGIGMQRPVQWMEGHRIPRSAAVAILLVGGLAIIAGFLALVLPSVIHEASSLADHGPEYIRRFRHQSWVRNLDDRFDLTDKLRKLGRDLPDDVWTFSTGLLSAIVDGLTILVLTAYFAVDLPRLRSTLAGLLVPAHRERFDAIADRVTQRMGGYVVGNLIVSVIAGVTTFVAMLVIGVPYAAALGMWVAITDLIPTIGALLGAAVVMAVAGVSGGVRDLLIAGAFFLVYQQVENYLVVPRVMRGAINMTVGAVLISVLIGGQLGGFVGVLLALPVAAAIQTVLDELWLKERRRSVRLLELREERVRRWMSRLGRRPRGSPGAPVGPSS
jgi:predicted PurR-regulated permease PerM